jgi:hypothetical protein
MGPAVPKHQEHAHGPATTAITELKTVFYDAFDQLVHVCFTQLDIELGRQAGQKRHPLLQPTEFIMKRMKTSNRTRLYNLITMVSLEYRY